jgi:hypothetical protein
MLTNSDPKLKDSADFFKNAIKLVYFMKKVKESQQYKPPESTTPH